MKKYNMNGKQKRIGELVNEFDNLPEEKSSLGTFNSMFGLEIEGEESTIVEIGEPEIGNRRIIFVNDKEIVVNMETISEVGIEPYRSRKEKYGR